VTQKTFIERFDMVRIINMVSRTDRRDETINEFKRANFSLNSEQVSFYAAITPDTADGFPNKGTKGCFLSHLNVLREAKARGVNNVLVLEDDIAFVRKINKIGVSAFDNLADLDWDLAYFGHVMPSCENDLAWRVVTAPMLSAHCYAVNGKSLGKLIDMLEVMLTRQPGDPNGGPMHYDGALNFFINQQNAKAFYFGYCLGYQRPSVTNIHELKTLDKLRFLAPLSWIFRRLKRWLLRLTR